MAESCPHCGMPTSEIKAAATISTNQPKKKNGMPTWAWILIIAGSLLIVGGIVFLCFTGKSHSPNTIQEEAVQKTYPAITTKGVEPFIVGSSMLDIPAKGSFYDTIILIKYYDWCEKCGEMSGKQCTETEYKAIYNDFNGDILVEKCYGVAMIIKDRDTIMTIDYDENAKITAVTVLSDMFQMENGIHVGMGASDLLKDFDARFVTQNDGVDGHTFLSDIYYYDV